MLRLAGTDISKADNLRPIPFPRHRVAGRRAEAGRRDRMDLGPETDTDAGRLIDDAIGDVQSKIDELDAIFSEPLPFPGRDADDDGDDRPPAA